MIRTSTRTSIRGKLTACSALLAMMGSEIVNAGPFDSPGRPANRTRPAVYQTEEAPPVSAHRLTYLNAPWEKVLTEVSKTSGKQLIMAEVPPGKFSRRDFVPHSTRETIHILNQELERQGFRLLEQNDYLIVLNLASVRTRYSRSTIAPQEGAGVQQVGDQQITPIDPPRRTIRRFSEVTVDDTPGRVTTANATYPTGAANSSIQQTAHDIASPEVSQESQQVVRRKVSPEASVVEVARYLHESFGESSQLIETGPGGLPAFEVKQFTGRPGTAPVSFAVGIDADENQLIIEATRGVADNLEKSVGILDKAIQAKREKIQIVPSTRDVKRLADELGPSMNKLLALHQQEQTTEEEADTTTQVQVPIGPGSQPGDFDSPAISAQMRGNVTVQAMPELGVLILTGNTKDVEAVLAVIKEIEKMAVGTTPSIRMHLLQNVDSSQLSTLLDTVYEDLTSRRPTATGQPGATTAQDNRRKVTFIPVVRPNAILVIAPESDMEAVLTLVDSLDIPVDPETVFEVFSLKSAIASQVELLLEDFFADRTGLSGTINVFSDPRSNSVIVRARPIDLNEASALIRKVDRDASSAVNKMKVIELKNSVAQEIADVINLALQSLMLPPGQNATQGGFGTGGAQAFGAAGTGQTSQSLREVKSVALEFLSTQGGREELVRSGILADVRITADPRINSLIVTAPSKSMGLLEALIKHLDRLPSSIAEIKVFTLQNSDATRAAELLSSLFQSTTTTGGGAGGFGTAAQTQGSGIQVLGATDISNSLVQMRFTVDIRTNSIVAVGGADALKLAEAILLRLDQDDVRQRKTAVITLKNTDATTLATTINGFLETQRALYLSTPDLVSNIELLERDVVVFPDAVTNQLMVSATERYFDSMIEMIGKLDQAPPEVIIQALIVEVTLDNIDEFGVELGLQDSILFDRSAMGMPGFLFNSAMIGNNTAAPNPEYVGGQGLSNLGVGRTNSDAGFGGLVLSASSESVSVLIRALAARRNVQILSRPQIRTLNNIQAQIQVGQQVPFVAGFSTSNSGNAPIPDYRPTGIILTVRPRINPDGTIVMETTAEKSALSGDTVPLSNDPVNGVVSSPIIDQTGAQSTVSISNGHTIVMGGMITESDTTEERKVPWLGDVPLLGRAFRFDTTSSQRTELLIFLTPRVIMGDADSEYVKQVEAERLHYIEDDAEQVHGPLFGVPAEPYYFEQEGPILLPDGSVLNPEYYPNLETKKTRPDSGIRQVSAEVASAHKSASPRAKKPTFKLWPWRK